MTTVVNEELRLKVGQAACAECSKMFEYLHTAGSHKKYCEECRILVLRRGKNKRLKEYRQTEK